MGARNHTTATAVVHYIAWSLCIIHILSGDCAATEAAPQPLVDVSSNLASLADLPSHVAAAGELVERLQLPRYYSLGNSSLDTVDPLKDAAARHAAEARCDRMLGEYFLQKWNANARHFCTANGEQQGALTSNITCYAAPMHAKGRPLTACVATNLVMTTSEAFMGSSIIDMAVSKELVQSVPPSKVLDSRLLQELPHPEPNSIEVACTAAAVNKSAEIVRYPPANGTGYVFVDHIAQWFVTALQDKQYEAVQQACGVQGANVIEHPVLFISRVGTKNIFHAMEDIIVALAFLAAHNATVAKGLQVVFTDQNERHPFITEELWRHVSTAGPLRYLRSEPYAPNTCFRTAIVVPVGYDRSMLSMAVCEQMRCRSPLGMGVASWIRQVLRPQVVPAQHLPDTFSTGAQPKPRICKGAKQHPLMELQILFLARHQPDTSTLVDENGSGYKRWQAMRDLPNEEEVVAAVKATALAWNTRLCTLQQEATGKQEHGCRAARAMFSVEVHEHHHHHNLLRQIQGSASASIIVGVHGAGLTHAFFMPPGGAVLEIFPMPARVTHYVSLANMMGHGYMRSEYQWKERTANVTDVTSKLVALMGELGGCAAEAPQPAAVATVL